MSNFSSITPAIETKSLTKSFGDQPALQGIDLSVSGGESLVILGPNGAGKTTLIKVLATIMNPTAGELLIDGINVKQNAESARRHIGVVTHSIYFYSNLTAEENLQFYARLYDVPEERIAEVVEMVGMTARVHDRVGTFSRGMQQRMSIARALLHRPSIMLLDEPETGLDQQALAFFWKLLKGEGPERRTVVMATHHLERGLELGDRLVILCRGKIAYEQKTAALDLPGLQQAYYTCTRG